MSLRCRTGGYTGHWREVDDDGSKGLPERCRRLDPAMFADHATG
jgi:hypothetical protein